MEAINRVRSGREGKKKSQLLLTHSKEKVDKLCASLRAKGMWAWDPDFPGDEEACVPIFQKNVSRQSEG